MAYDRTKIQGLDNARGVWQKIGRPSWEHEPPDTSPDPSAIFVEGRAYVVHWPDALRRRFKAFCDFAAEIGLTVHEVDPGAGPRPRKTWSYERVSLEDAFLDIKFRPGIPFEEWAQIYLPREAVGDPAKKAARQKARVALSRLYHEGRVEKRYRGEDGALVLYEAGKAPPLPTEDELRAARNRLPDATAPKEQK